MHIYIIYILHIRTSASGKSWTAGFFVFFFSREIQSDRQSSKKPRHSELLVQHYSFYLLVMSILEYIYILFQRIGWGRQFGFLGPLIKLRPLQTIDVFSVASMFEVEIFVTVSEIEQALLATRETFHVGRPHRTDLLKRELL